MSTKYCWFDFSTLYPHIMRKIYRVICTDLHTKKMKWDVLKTDSDISFSEEQELNEINKTLKNETSNKILPSNIQALDNYGNKVKIANGHFIIVFY